MSDPNDYLPPELLARYHSVKEVGRGGMGRVLRAEDQELGRTVAIKVLMETEFGGGDLEARFLEEGRICSRLRHPNVVGLFDVGVPGRGFPPYLIFEFIEGVSLDDRICDLPPLSGPQALGILIDVGAGLAHAHAAGVIHRDLKPENVLLDKNGVAKVADFGLAKDDENTVKTRRGLLLGTPPFMAPEYIRGKPIVPASDQYALGVLAYLLFTGRLPFDDENPTEILKQHVKSPVPDLKDIVPEVSGDLNRWIRRCLAKTPEERFPSIQHFIAKLQARRHQLDDDLADYSVPSLSRSDLVAPVARDGSTRVNPRLDTAEANRRDTHVVPIARPRSHATVIAGGIALVALATAGIFHLTRSTQTASNLVVLTSPTGLQARWTSDGACRLVILDQDRKPASEPLLPAQRDDAFEVQFQGLTPDTEYTAHVVDLGDRLLQSVPLRTAEDLSIAAPKMRLAGSPATITLGLRPRHPVAHTWRAESPVEGGWKLLAQGGAEGVFHQGQDWPLPGVQTHQPVRITVDVFSPGLEKPTQFLVSRGEAPALTRLRHLLGPKNLSIDLLEQALTAYHEGLLQAHGSAEAPPGPLEVLSDLGVPEDLGPVLKALPAFFANETSDPLHKLEANRLLVNLAGFDLFAEGWKRSPQLGIRELARVCAPFSATSTLPGGGLPLGKPWASRRLISGREERSLHLFTDTFLDRHAPDGKIRMFRIGMGRIKPAEILAYLENKRRVPLWIEIEREIPSGEIELKLYHMNFHHRHWFTVSVNGHEEQILWYPGDSEHPKELPEHVYTTHVRILGAQLQRGANRLDIGIRTLPGEHGSMHTAALVGATLRSRR